MYSPVDITVVKNCVPSAAEDKGKQDFAKVSITKIQVPVGCTAQFNDYTIITFIGFLFFTTTGLRFRHQTSDIAIIQTITQEARKLQHQNNPQSEQNEAQA